MVACVPPPLMTRQEGPTAAPHRLLRRGRVEPVRLRSRRLLAVHQSASRFFAGYTGRMAAGSPEWRTETYGGVQVEVPGDWGYGNTSWPPCVRQPERGYVGRPGFVPAVACGELVPSLGERVPYLWFDSHLEAGIRTHDAGWAEETRTVAGVRMTVLAGDAELRARILDSARPTPDATHPITGGGPRLRPDPRPGLAGIGAIASVTIRRFALATRPRRRPENPLLSMTQVTGEVATRLVEMILTAPEGTGPNRPEDCSPQAMYGNEAMVLTVEGAAGTQEVFVRYHGCDGHGFDDGHTRRQLTTEAITPLLSGPHSPTSLNTSVAELIWNVRRRPGPVR